MGSIRSGSGGGGGGSSGGSVGGILAYPEATQDNSVLHIPTRADGRAPYAAPVGQDELSSPYSVTLSPARTVDVGTTLVDPTFAVGYSSAPVSSVLTDNAGHAPRDLLGAPPSAYPGDTSTSIHAVGSYPFPAVGSSYTWVVTANGGGVSHSYAASATAAGRLFFGVLTLAQLAADDATLAATIAALPSRLQSTRGGSYSITPGPSDFGVWWIRSPAGTPIFQLAGNLPGGVSLVKSGLVVSNGHGFSEPGNVFRVDNPGLGGVWTLT